MRRSKADAEEKSLDASLDRKEVEKVGFVPPHDKAHPASVFPLRERLARGRGRHVTSHRASRILHRDASPRLESTLDRRRLFLDATRGKRHFTMRAGDRAVQSAPRAPTRAHAGASLRGRGGTTTARVGHDGVANSTIVVSSSRSHPRRPPSPRTRRNRRLRRVVTGSGDLTFLKLWGTGWWRVERRGRRRRWDANSCANRRFRAYFAGNDVDRTVGTLWHGERARRCHVE